MDKKVEDYMQLPYTRMIKKIIDSSGEYYVCEILELDGCFICGETIEEVEREIGDVMEGYFELKLEGGFHIPKPVMSNGYSGKFVVRMPTQLHQRLSVEAKREGVSLNQYALYKLAR